MFASVKNGFVRFPIATCAAMGVSAFMFKIGAIATYHEAVYARHELERQKELRALKL